MLSCCLVHSFYLVCRPTGDMLGLLAIEWRHLMSSCHRRSRNMQNLQWRMLLLGSSQSLHAIVASAACRS
jgi:hypothetical protein